MARTSEGLRVNHGNRTDGLTRSVTIHDPESGVGILVTQSVGSHGPHLTYVSIFPYDAARKVYAQDAGRDPGDNMTAYGTED